MKKLVAVLVVALALVAAPRPAMATPFVGSVDYVGTFTLTDGNTFMNSTTFSVNLALVLLSSGSFSALVPVGTLLTHASPITYVPPTFPINPLWTAPSGVVFDLTKFVVSNITASTLILKGNGFFSCIAGSACDLAGLTTTKGAWVMTLNLATGQITGSFSSSSSAVPEPASVLLLGLGLLGGAGALRRRRMAK